MDGLDSWLQLGGLGIGGVALVLIFMGRLLPSPWVNQLLSSKDQVIARQQETLDQQTETLDRMGDAIDHLLESSKTITHALESIQSKGRSS